MTAAAVRGVQGSASTLGAWWAAIRPKTLPASMAPVLVGSFLAHREAALSWPIAIAAALATVCFQIGTNLHNDSADFERGADGADRLGPARAVARGWLSARRVRRAAYAAFAAAFVPGLYLVFVGGWPIVVIGVASVLAGLAYTGGPMPLAYNGLGDLFVFVFFGIVAVAGTYFLHTGTIHAPVVLVGCAVGSLTSAILVVNNLRDRVSDRAAEKRTMAVRFGATFARIEYAVLIASAYAFVAAAGHLLDDARLLAPLLSLPVAALLIRGVATLDGRALNPLLGQTAALTLAFSVLLALGGLW